MPPALNHKKSRKGCKRCKARKVRCDESKPKCLACSKHNVDCEYPNAGASIPTETRPNDDHLLELQLLHQWTAHTCETISTAWEFYKYEAPVLAFKFRYVMDAILALSALHISKHGMIRTTSLQVWDATKGNKTDDGATHTPKSILSDASSSGSRTRLSFEKRDLVKISRKYFSKALEGQRQAVSEIDLGNIKAAWVCAYLVSCYAMFTLSEGGSAGEDPGLEGVEWMSVSRGIIPLAQHWNNLSGPDWASEAGSMYGEPNLVDANELFRAEHRALFLYVLEPVEGETLTAEDQEAYEDTLSYIGLLHKVVAEGSETPLSVVRRIVAASARAPPRFAELVASYQPRAVVVLAHFFAIVGIAGERIPWLTGIAQRQVPVLCGRLDGPWRSMVEWPLAVLSRCDGGLA